MARNDLMPDAAEAIREARRARTNIAAAEARLRGHSQAFSDALQAAHDGGMSLQQIANALGLSKTAIAKRVRPSGG